MRIHQAILLTSLALPASAQAVSAGLSAGALVPTFELHEFNRNPGGTLGGFLDLDYGHGHVFRPRIDVAFLPRTTQDEGGISFKRDFWAGSLGVDCDWYLTGSRTGAYFQAGAGLYHMVARAASVAGTSKATTDLFGGSFGIGYDFSASWGLSLRYAYSTFKSALPDQQSMPNPTAGMVVLAANCRL